MCLQIVKKNRISRNKLVNIIFNLKFGIYLFNNPTSRNTKYKLNEFFIL